MSAQRFPYTPMPPFQVDAGRECASRSRRVFVYYACLVDSGAAMNLLPFECGEQLGFVWNEQRLDLPMGGLLPDAKAFAVPVTLTLDLFEPIELAFAWTNVPQERLRSCSVKSTSFTISRLRLRPMSVILALLPNHPKCKVHVQSDDVNAKTTGKKELRGKHRLCDAKRWLFEHPQKNRIAAYSKRYGVDPQVAEDETNAIGIL